MRSPNMKVASHTIPMYEYRQRNWFEQMMYNFAHERHINKLLFKDRTFPALCVIILAIVIAGLLVVGIMR